MKRNADFYISIPLFYLVIFGFLATSFASVQSAQAIEQNRGFSPETKKNSNIQFDNTVRKRKALIIGNSAYLYVNRLTNSRNDAIDINTILKKFGFQTQLVLDADMQKMNQAFETFIKQANKQDTLFIFYAGHGFQHQSSNLIAPIDVRLNPETNQIDNIINLSTVFQRLVKASSIRILFLDACRNDPTAIKLASNSNKDKQPKQNRPIVTRAIQTRAFVNYQNGFGQMKGAEPGTFIAYSTASGDVAADGLGITSRNSPFTKSFLKHVDKSNLNILDLMTNVTNDVYVETLKIQKPQTPWSESSLLAPFFFIDKEWTKWLVKQVQIKLRDARCYAGKIDGDWGPSSKSALSRYNKASGKTLPVKLVNLSTLDYFKQESKSYNCPKAARKKIEKRTKISTRQVTKPSGKSKCYQRAQRYCSNPDNSSAIGYSACMTHAKQGCREQ